MKKTGIIVLLFTSSAILLALKAFQIQILDLSYRNRGDAAAIEKFTTYPPRGLIYDRHGRLMVYNEPLYDLMLTYQQLDPQMDTLKFCKLLDIKINDFEELVNKDWKSGRFSKRVPFVFLSKVNAKTITRFQENLYEFPGFFIQKRNVRGYPDSAAPHLLGLIREVNSTEVENSNSIYRMGDYIGASGLESIYEKELRGKKGLRYILRDNLGRKVGAYLEGSQDIPPEAGNDLITTIDQDLQRYILFLMEGKKGGVVAIEPATGEILALVSTPGYDPNGLTIGRERSAIFSELLINEDKPFFDRTTMAQYPPGSLFKPFVALIGLQEGVISQNRGINCSGAYFFNGIQFTGCRNHPSIENISDAIKYSCNTYFVTIFREIVDRYGFYLPKKGLDTYNAYLDQFGFGKTIGLDFQNEQKGFFPTSEYFTNLYKQDRWNSLWIQSIAIGQGEMLTTNLQLANAMAMMANKGFYYPPHLVKEIRDKDGGVKKIEIEKIHTGVDEKHFDAVIEGMEQVVLAGTARLANIPGITVCGKTGTAQNPQGEDHSIFFSFAPKISPQIAVVAYLENYGSGGGTAAPLASLVIEKYLNDTISDQRKWVEQYVINKKPKN
jgi:penicillin-binding protein 2